MPKSDYADILASHEKHPSAQEETSLPNPALIGSQEPEVGSYPSENPNNDALCNGVAPARKSDDCYSNVPIPRRTNNQISEVDSCPSENPNNDALCNGVAPARKADGCSSDVPVTRCTD